MFDFGDTFRCHRTAAQQSLENGLKSAFDFRKGYRVARTELWQQWIGKIAEAGLAGDTQRLELILLKVIRALKRENPELGSELGAILSQYSSNPSGLRWKESGPPPTDAEEGLPLVRLDSTEDSAPPILPEALNRQVEQFLMERNDQERLLVEGFSPPRSVLLVGEPGTGKTMLASWLAFKLKLPLVSLDLATSISSFLGKTGFNIRRVLDYARSRKCVLLLDEFDAIAKRRDDSTEMGELKRIVNVLLKELEDWPLQSVLIAATNHPGLLDPAIRRRFDIVLALPLPGKDERRAILERAAGRFSSELSDKLISAFANAMEGSTAADVQGLMQAAVRHHLSWQVPLQKSVMHEFQTRMENTLDSKSLGPLLRKIQSGDDRPFTVRELAEIFGKSPSTIQHHLGKEVIDG
ncbi:AAA family ATPase [Lacipirellula parvula]|uniref:Putative ATPase n=1 Tax=Lacipirellula parvula TaxID=2650471 RepID=A0A5K7XIZ8_9BACT|nr:AAA family ATPase [Lacipirellula parvula]BBO34173.1 putative ATPase [Lacipirellula parvula]